MVKTKKSKHDNSTDLVLEHSLQGYFFDQLMAVNKTSTCPLPNETIYYSSLVMDRLAESKHYFEINEGRWREKVLGVKLLETNQMSVTGRKRALQDIGDMALMICGYFSESLNKKIVDVGYYQELGQIAYRRLDKFIPDAYEMPSFFKILSGCFQNLTMIMNLVSQRDMAKSTANTEEAYLFVSELSKIKVS